MAVTTRAALALIVVLVFVAGCDGTPPPATGPTTSAVTSSAVDPALAQACADVTRIINEATTAFTAALAKAVAAGEGHDTKTQAAAIAEIKAAFADWSAKIRAQAGKAADPELKAVLTDYAGAVDAVIARVKTSADLDKLATFDDQELDTAAGRLADICG